MRLDPALMSIWVPGCLARYVILFFLHAPGGAVSGVGAGGVPAGGRRGAAAADRPPAGAVCGGARVPLHEPAQPLQQRAGLQEEEDGALLQGSRGHHRRPQANLFQQGAVGLGGVSLPVIYVNATYPVPNAQHQSAQPINPQHTHHRSARWRRRTSLVTFSRRCSRPGTLRPSPVSCCSASTRPARRHSSSFCWVGTIRGCTSGPSRPPTALWWS